MKTLYEKELIPNLVCEFKASGETNDAVQVKFADHFDNLHSAQRSKMSPDEILAVDKKAFALLSAQT
jgi:hypothetical protein